MLCQAAMLRLLVASVVLVALASSPAGAQCDPYAQETEIKIPRALQLATTCGNGRIDTFATECVQRVSGGCGYPTKTSRSCTKTQETCDGRAFNGDTCKARGYTGGSLRCVSSCTLVDYARCTVCPSTGVCRERAVRYDQFEDITLLAQGNTIRAFWYDDVKGFYVADVDDHGTLGKPRKLAGSGSFRLIPVQVGTSALTVVGEENKLQLSVVPASGAPTLVAVPGRSAPLFMPVLPTSTNNLAVAILGSATDANVLLVDAAGQSQPLTAVYGQNAYRRAALVAVAPGKHTLRWAKYEATITAEPGDLLLMMYDYTTNVSLVRKGHTILADAGSFHTLSGVESKDVALDGKPIATFGATEDVIGTVKHARTANAPTAPLLAPIVYERKLVSVARTSALEVHAARIPRSDDGAGQHTLAIAVHAIGP